MSLRFARFEWLALFALPLALASACGSDEDVAPALVPKADAAPPPPPPPPPPDGGKPAQVKRSVSVRNPFGNVQAKDNLLWDGDFEWATPFSQQYGWVNAGQLVTYSAFEQVRPDANCRSGLKCGYLTQNQRVAALGVAPGADKKIDASVWVKVPASCGDVSVSLVACEYLDDPDVVLSDADATPDAQGWCRYEAIAAPRKHATCLLIDATFDEGEAWIDDAVMRAAPDSAVVSARARSAGESQHIEGARARIREALRPGPRMPSEGRRKFEAWQGRAR